MRHLSHELRPVILDDFGLVAALEFLAQGVSQRTALVITVESTIEGRLSAVVETALYRILQETLTNVSKHAHAKRVCVRLHQDVRTISCSIEDDGIGFDASAVCHNRDKTGLGLIGIRERLAALGGALSIVSAPGRGTTVEVTIPLKRSRRFDAARR